MTEIRIQIVDADTEKVLVGYPLQGPLPGPLSIVAQVEELLARVKDATADETRSMFEIGYLRHVVGRFTLYAEPYIQAFEDHRRKEKYGQP